MAGDRGKALLDLVILWLMTVSCPICGRSVLESDINVHLDLQCPGALASSSQVGPSQTKPQPPSSKNSNGAASQNSVIVIEDTPVKAKRKEVSIFGSVGRKRDRAAEDEDIKPDISALGKAESTEAPKQIQEKKPRLNPLVANQP